MHKIVLYSIILCFSTKAYTQDSSRFLLLDTVRIIDYKLSTNLFSNWLGSHTNQIISHTLGDQISQQPVNLKNYGLNNISMLSLQGGSSYHTIFYWDEIPVQNPLNGVFDVSLIPGGLFDQININTANTSSQVGSGAISGTVDLQTPYDKPKTMVWARLETSKNATIGLKHTHQHKKWLLYTALVYQPDENQYRIENQQNKIQKITCAQSKKWSLIQRIDQTISKNITVGANIWINDSKRNTPQNIFTDSIFSCSAQQDFWINSSIHALYAKNKTTLLLKYAFLHNRSLYQDTLRDIKGDHMSQTHYAEFRFKQDINPNLNFLLDIQSHSVRAVSSNFEHIPIFTKWASIAMINAKFKKTFFNLSWRKELNQSKGSPNLWSASANRYYKASSAYVQVSKNYRYPSLNDLYWNPGGNLDLKPEESLKQELGLRIHKKNWKGQLNIFHAHVNNWILWIPTGAYWSPQNILQVQNKGLESSISFEYLYKQWTFSWTMLTNTTFSTNKTKATYNNESYNKQMIFTPFFNGNASFELQYKNWSVFVLYQYNGKRFYTTDNSLYVPHYHLLNSSISKKWNAVIPFTSSLSIHNVLNTSYMNIPNNPLPLRYYSLQLLFNLKN